MLIKVGIAGLTPLIMNRFDDHAEVQVTAGTRASIRGMKETPREQAKRKAYMDGDGMLFIPGPNIFACLVAAGQFHKSGRVKLTTHKSSLIPAGLIIVDHVCSLGTDHWEVDARSVVIPATQGRVMAYRPRLDEWKTSFTIDLDIDMFSPNFVRLLVDDAGKKIGLGDFRPSRRGPFGRFVVTSWEPAKS